MDGQIILDLLTAPCFRFFRPKSSVDGDYNGRKLGYTISSMIVSDADLIIRHMHAGWTRSTYDDRIMRNSDMCKNSEQLFSVYEYLIGCSSHTSKDFIIPAHKDLCSRFISEDETFLTHFCLQLELDLKIALDCSKIVFLFSKTCVLFWKTESIQWKKFYATSCLLLHFIIFW